MNERFFEWPPAGCRKTLASGEALYRQGQAVGQVYAIVTGHLKLECLDAAGEASISAILGAGQLLAPGLGGARRSPHTATAKGMTLVHRYEAAQFDACLASDSTLGPRVIAMLARRQDVSERRLTAVLTLGVRGRIAVVLHDLLGQAGGPCAHGHEIDVPLTQQELAQMVGASRPVVSTELNAMRREGLLDYTRRHLCVNDLEALVAEVSRFLPDC